MRNIKYTYILSTLLIILLLPFNATEAQNTYKRISGVVSEAATGDPMPGVTIRVKGKTEGTITDYDGKFALRVFETDILIFSFIGMVTQEVPVGLNKTLKVDMLSDLEQLDEIVVTGYGTTKAKDVTGSIKSIKLDQIEDNASASVDEMLQGRLAGVRLNKADGAPGQAMVFEIRGSNSITGSSDPLYIVDGFPIDDPSYITTIAPEDIERIDILKDASATAIYGSRGSNGVVIISTKSGVEDSKTKVNVNVQQGRSMIPRERRLDVLSSYEFVKLQQELGSTSYGDAEQYRNVEGTNWQNEIFKPGDFSRVNASLQAGNDLTRLFASFGYVNEDGTMLNTGFKRYTGRLKVDHKISKKLDVGINVAYTNTEYSGMKVSTSTVSAVKSSIMFRPVLPVNNNDYEEDQEEEYDAGYYPPDQTLLNTERSEPRDVIQVNSYLNYKIAKNLKFRTTFGYTYDNKSIKYFYNEGTNQADRGVDGINGSIKTSLRRSWVNENTLTYNLKKQDHHLNVLAGVTLQDAKIYETYMKSNLFPFDDFGWNDFSLGISPQVSQSNLSNTRLLSGLSRVNYTFKDKYLVTASFRADGSSKFPSTNKFGYFPSFAFAWRAIEEPFIQNLNVFSNLKVKTGYGMTGNNRVGNFDSMVTYGSGNGYYFGNNYYPGIYQKKMANTDLKWETTQQFNAGLEMGFLKNRIIVDTEMYYKLTDDLLLDALVPPTAGFTGVKENRGSISNYGLELSIQTVNVHTNDIKWTSSFNISFNRNEVRKLSIGEDERLYNPNVGRIFEEENIYGLFVGQPVGVMYGYRKVGMFQVDDFIQDPNTGELALRDGVTQLDHTAGILAPGMPMYADLDGNGIVDENDREVIGNPNPLHHGGLHNAVEFKNFDLGVLLTWSYGNDIFNGNRAVFGVPGAQRNRNYLGEVANRWTPENPIEDGVWAAPSGERSYIPVYSGKMMSDFWIEDGSYIRIKNVALGYSFPKRWMDKINVSKMRVSATIDNLWVFTKYSGYDPEVSVKNEALNRGIDYSAYPKGRTLTFGLNVIF